MGELGVVGRSVARLRVAIGGGHIGEAGSSVLAHEALLMGPKARSERPRACGEWAVIISMPSRYSARSNWVLVSLSTSPLAT